MKALKSLFFATIFPFVPKRMLSRLTGLLMRIPLPPGFRGLLIQLFAQAFSIRLEEAEFPPGDYATFDAFFTRRLKAGLRPIQAAVVHPVDGFLSQKGPLIKGELIQAKGWTYPLDELLGDAELAKEYAKGSFFTYYLCPADYHRVHAPRAGSLESARHIPGLLWPVNTWSVTRVKRLFNLNERVVLNFKTDSGRYSLVMVGATNVGRMTIDLDPTITTNRWLWHAPTSRAYMPPPRVQVGEELGRFHLGSTVICIYDQNLSSEISGPVKMGGALESRATSP